MKGWIATLVYELHPSTEPEARKLLRAELVGRRFQDRLKGQLMPAGSVWIERLGEPGHTTDDIFESCAADLHNAVAAVAATGRKIALVRAYVQVAGTGTFGIVKLRTGEG